MYACDLPGVKELAAGVMGGAKNLAASRKAVHDAGYNGEKIVILNPTDYAFIHVAGLVTADLLTKLGMNVDLQEMDFGTLLQRRTSRETVEKGGWSIFHTGANADGMGNPGTNFYIRGQGATGWPGWFTSPEMERLTDAWMASTNETEAAQLLDRIQLLAVDQVPFLPLGQWYVRSALSRSLSGLVPASNTLFWNLKRG
jgi:peptide/nickel transport system substrate-binding protein